MLKRLSGIWLCLCSGTLLYAQDTIRSGASIHYTSTVDPVRDKTFAARAKYAKETIVFSPTHQKIEYCYYYDDERVCFGNEYEIISDSLLKKDDQEWFYKQVGSRYYIRRYNKGLYESGYAKSLVPLIVDGQLTTTSLDYQDILWHADYTDYNTEPRHLTPNYFFHSINIEGKIYQAKKLSHISPMLKGDTIIKLKLDPDNICYGSPYILQLYLFFTITDKGRLVNFEQRKGSNIIQPCPYDVLDLVRQLYLRHPFQSITRKGKAVNVRCMIRVLVI